MLGTQGEECEETETAEGGGLKLRDEDDGPEDGKAEVFTVGCPDEDQACLRALVVPLAGPGGSSIDSLYEKGITNENGRTGVSRQQKKRRTKEKAGEWTAQPVVGAEIN